MKTVIPSFAESDNTEDVDELNVLEVSSSRFRTGSELSCISSSQPSLNKHTKQRIVKRKDVLRRLNGVLNKMESTESRVTLFPDSPCPDVENHYEYVLPSKSLRKSKICTCGQPFEMDEVEILIDDGSIIFGYEFRPLAIEKDMVVGRSDLSLEQLEVIGQINKRFSKEKNNAKD